MPVPAKQRRHVTNLLTQASSLLAAGARPGAPQTWGCLCPRPVDVAAAFPFAGQASSEAEREPRAGMTTTWLATQAARGGAMPLTPPAWHYGNSPKASSPACGNLSSRVTAEARCHSVGSHAHPRLQSPRRSAQPQAQLSSVPGPWAPSLTSG